MNKKAQYIPQGVPMSSGTKVHPIMIIGIFIFVLPFLGPIVNIKIPGFVNIIGLVVLFIGIGLTIWKNVTN